MTDKVSVLGTIYNIKMVNISETKLLKENGWGGSCNSVTHEILIGNPKEEEYYGELSAIEQEIKVKDTLRHEIIHAFFNESGLQNSTSVPRDGWATNEEMVDWMAIQAPKLFKAFREAGCI